MKKNKRFATKISRKLVSIILSWGMLVSMILPVTAEDTLSEVNETNEILEVQNTNEEVVSPEEVIIEEVDPTVEPVITTEPVATEETVIDEQIDDVVEDIAPTSTPVEEEVVEEEIDDSIALMSLENEKGNDQEKKKGCSVVFEVQDAVTNFKGEKNFQELNCGEKFDFVKKEIPTINDKDGKFEVLYWLISNDSKQNTYDDVVTYLTNTTINENIIITAVVDEIVKEKATLQFVSADSNLGTLSGTTTFESEYQLPLNQLTIPTPNPTEGSKFLYWTVNGQQYKTNNDLNRSKITVEPGSSLTVTAVFEKIKTISVIFNTEGNGEYNTKYKTEFTFTRDTSLNSIYREIPQPTKASLKNFKYWKVSINGNPLSTRFYGTQFPNDTALCTVVGRMKLGDYVVITAVFGDPKIVSVNFEVDSLKGSTQDTATFSGNENTIFNNLVSKVPTVNVTNGYKFIGWKHNDTTYSEAEIINMFGQKMISNSMTFTAIFEESIVLLPTTMTFNTNGKGTVDNKAEISFTEELQEGKGGITIGELMGDAPIPTPTGNEGYEFAGWKLPDDKNLYSTEELAAILERSVIQHGDTYMATAIFYGEEDYGYVKFVAGVNGKFEGDLTHEIFYQIPIEQGQGVHVSTLMVDKKYPEAIGNTNYELIGWNIQSSNGKINIDYESTEEMLKGLGPLVITPNMGYIVTAIFDKKEPNTMTTYLKFNVEGNGTVNGLNEVVLNKQVAENSSITANIFTENGALIPLPVGMENEEFIGWRVGSREALMNTKTLNTNLEYISVNAGGTLVITAVFKEVKETSLQFTVRGPGSFVENDENVESLIYTEKVPTDETINAKKLIDETTTPTVAANENARFVGWLYGENTDPKDVYDLNAYLYETAITAGKTLTVIAVFEENPVVTPTPTPTIPTTPTPTTPPTTNYIPPVEVVVPVAVVPVVQAPAVPVVPEVIPEEITPEVAPTATPEIIQEDETPLVVNKSTWSLINLILMLATLGGGLIYVFKKKEENDTQTIERKGKLLSVLSVIGSIALFFLTQDLLGKMIMVDTWTIAMAVVALVQGGIFYFGKKKENINQTQA